MGWGWGQEGGGLTQKEEWSSRKVVANKVE